MAFLSLEEVPTSHQDTSSTTRQACWYYMVDFQQILNYSVTYTILSLEKTRRAEQIKFMITASCMVALLNWGLVQGTELGYSSLSLFFPLLLTPLFLIMLIQVDLAIKANDKGDYFPVSLIEAASA